MAEAGRRPAGRTRTPTPSADAGPAGAAGDSPRRRRNGPPDATGARPTRGRSSQGDRTSGGTGGKGGPGQGGPSPTGAPAHPAVAAVASGGWVERVMAGEPVSRRRGRLGLLWFLLAVVAAVLGLAAVALLFAVVAGVAGLQTSAAWERVRKHPVQLVAGAGAFAMVLSAALGTALVGLLGVLFVVAAVIAAALDPARRAQPRRPAPGVVAVAGLAVRCGYFTALGAAGAVAVARIDGTAFVVLLVLVSAYEVGDYLVGTGAGTPVEGPLAGIAAVGVLTFALSVFQLGPFDTKAAWVFGGLVAVLAPLGPIVASTLVPTAAAGGPALRRLDSWILVGPAWAWMLWNYLH